METGRLLITEPCSGAVNMAIDQTLLELAESEGQSTLRFYQWYPATVSLGYFQSADSRLGHSGSRDLDWVRRTTGGGAIVHDHELTYSLVVPRQHRWSTQNEWLYDAIHEALIRVLADHYGIVGARFGELAKEITEVGTEEGTEGESVVDSSAAPFLCFLRRSAGDVIVKGHKILGSAQRRYRNSLLQHGSLLLQMSGSAPELSGLAEISGKPWPIEPLRGLWVQEISRALGVEFVLHDYEMSPEFQQRVAYWTDHHHSQAWKYKR